MWLVLVGGLAGLVAALAHAFPEAVRKRADWANVAYAAMLVVLVSAGLLRARRGLFSQHLRNAALWSALVAILALGFAYRAELAGVPQHLRLAFSTGEPVTSGDHELVVPQDDQGAFVVVAAVNGRRVRFVVDTGASDTVLSPQDARALGIDVERLHYDAAAETANGVGYGARYVARRLQVGPIGLDDFPMVVNQSPLSASLLGLSFLDRLAAFEVHDRKLILRWRDPTAA